VTTFHDLLLEAAKSHGPRPAILFGAQTLSYEEVLERSLRFASGLSRLGVGAGDRVAIVMENSVECIFAWLASNVLGCTDVPVNPQYRGDLLRYLLLDCDASVVVCDAGFAAHVAEVAPEVATLRLAIVNGAVTSPVTWPAAVSTVSLAEVDGPTGAVARVSGAAEHVFLYTSGTTGPSKGVIHTQRSCLTLSRYNAKMLDYTMGDRLLNFFPLYHQNARYTGIIPALCSGASIRLERRFSSSSFWATCDADGTTAFNYLGSVLRLILNVTPPDRVAGSHSVTKAFGAGAHPGLWEQCESRLGIRLVETYGLTEAPMATINARLHGRPSPAGSAGRSSELFEVRVVDEAERFIEDGSIGEIVMRPRQPDTFMLGYHKKDAATVKAFRNLWFHSGDRGRLSPEGDLYFEERGKDSIRRRGENISAWEVESVLDQHPDVAESAVFALPSEDADEEVAAALVLKRSDADLPAILAYATRRLPKYAVPTLWRVMADLPRTPTAKVQKADLRSAGRAACTPADALRPPPA
jgi:crotonobetaine/carnitine-CoA ligase